MEYHKALRVIKLNLERKGLKIIEGSSALEIKGVYLDMTSERWAYHTDWTTANLCLKTIEYNTEYKNKRKRIMGFNILSGDYNKLINKIKELQQENIRIEKENNEEKIKQQTNKEKINDIFKNYNLKINTGNIEIETPYFTISIYPDNNRISIYANHTLNYKKVLELLTKLGIERRK